MILVSLFFHFFLLFLFSFFVTFDFFRKVFLLIALLKILLPPSLDLGVEAKESPLQVANPKRFLFVKAISLPLSRYILMHFAVIYRSHRKSGIERQ